VTPRHPQGQSQSSAPPNPGSEPERPPRPGGAQAFLQAGADNSIPEYGSEGPRLEKAQATKVLSGYLRARENEDWAVACSLMGTTVRGQVKFLAKASGGKAGSCVDALAALAKFSPPRDRVNVLTGPVAAFRVKRDHGFALFYGPHRRQFMMPMVREAGRWKVSQSIPVAYPIGAPVEGG
jgi:hypothetical protein